MGCRQCTVAEVHQSSTCNILTGLKLSFDWNKFPKENKPPNVCKYLNTVHTNLVQVSLCRIFIIILCFSYFSIVFACVCKSLM